jgi:hypothetical protein
MMRRHVLPADVSVCSYYFWFLAAWKSLPKVFQAVSISAIDETRESKQRVIIGGWFGT